MPGEHKKSIVVHIISEFAMKSRAYIQILCISLTLMHLPRAGAQGGGEKPLDPVLLRSRDDFRPNQIFISGAVLQESGAPPAGAVIELDCNGSVTKEATVEADGRFWFPLGESSRAGKQFQDVSQEIADPFARDSNTSLANIEPIPSTTTRVQNMPTGSTSLMGCTLRASLIGYKSSVIQLQAAPLSMINNVGIIVLSPIEKTRKSRVSATSLIAPESARKALKKAKTALRKSKVGDAEKHLNSAIRLYPKYAEAWLQLGNLYQAQRRIKEARDAYAKAMESDGLYADPYAWLAQISAAEQNWNETAELTAKALSLDPNGFPDAYYLNALAGFHLKNLDMAEKSALQSERMGSAQRFPRTYLILASICAGKNDMIGAIEELRKYLKYKPRNATALQKYERESFLNSVWEAAGESQKKEIALSAESDVRLALAQALSEAKMTGPAQSQTAARPVSSGFTKLPPRVNAVPRQSQEPEKSETAPLASSERSGAPGEVLVDYLNYPLQDLPGLEPVADQETMNDILNAVGNNVATLFTDLLNVSARESVQTERFEHNGKADPAGKFDYLYLCLGSAGKQDPVFTEYRSDEQGREIHQVGFKEGHMLTAGFVSAPLIFHPIHQSENAFRLLGRQKLGGRDTIVLAYAQIPGRCRLSGRFQVGSIMEETYKQGIAWIDAGNYQIIRLISDLLRPLPKLRLEKLSTQIDFDEVHFDKTRDAFWLPVRVAVIVHWNDRILRNTHAYAGFKLFDVETTQKVVKPKAAGKAVDRTPIP